MDVYLQHLNTLKPLSKSRGKCLLALGAHAACGTSLGKIEAAIHTEHVGCGITMEGDLRRSEACRVHTDGITGDDKVRVCRHCPRDHEAIAYSRREFVSR